MWTGEGGRMPKRSSGGVDALEILGSGGEREQLEGQGQFEARWRTWSPMGPPLSSWQRQQQYLDLFAV